jgi:hypothetical protein
MIHLIPNVAQSGSICATDASHKNEPTSYALPKVHPEEIQSNFAAMNIARFTARTMEASVVGAKPKATIRALALGLFDAIDAHPWVSSALTSAPGELPMVRILEPLGQQVRALGVTDSTQWAAVSALLIYILGVAGRNAANGQLARMRGLDRSDFLEAVATMWSELDPEEYPFTRSVAGQVRAHDDRMDFLAGIDLILKGIESPRRRNRALTEAGGQSEDRARIKERRSRA